MDCSEWSDDYSVEQACDCNYFEEAKEGDDEDIPCASCFYEPSYLLRKSCTLFIDNIATSMYHRHSRLLSEYVRVSSDGVLLRDLRYFIYTLEFLSKGIEQQPNSADLLRNMLDLICLPPLMIDPKESFSPLAEIKELFDALGYLVASMESLELRLRVVQTLHCLLLPRHARKCPPASPASSKALEASSQSKAPQQQPHPNSVPLHVLHAAAEISALAGIVGEFLEFAEPDLYTPLIDLGLLLSSISQRCGRTLANTGAIDFILLRLDPEYPVDSSGEYKDPCETSSLDMGETSLLWGMLRALQEANDRPSSKSTPSSQALRCLSNSLHSTLQDGYVPGAISLLSLVLLALHLFPDLPIVESGLADDIAIASVASEINNKVKWAETLALDRTRDAFELKRLLTLSIFYLAQQEKALEILKQRRVINGLIQLAETNAVRLSSWQRMLATALSDLALSALVWISRTSPVEIVKAGGFAYILLIIEKATTTQTDVERLLDCVSALNYIASVQNDNYVQEQFLATGAVCIVRRFCCNTLAQPQLAFERQRVLILAFMFLKKIFDHDNQNEKVRHGEAIIQLFDSFLKLVLSPDVSDEGFPLDDKMIISGFDFIWEVLVLSPRNCDKIIKEGFIYKILDLLQISIFPVQIVLLGLLVDIIEFSKCIPHIVTWRGKDYCAFLPLLMKIWRHEESFIAPHRDSYGCITEATLPLMGREQWFKTYSVTKPYDSSPAITDVYGSARPKIYAIIKLLRNRNKTIIEEIEEFYHVHMDLQLEEEITMQIAEKYLEMKMKEIWNETEIDLNNASITPTDTDSTMVKILNAKLFQWATEVQKKQLKLVEDIKTKEMRDEKNVCELVEGTNAIEAAETLRELEMVACASDPFFMNAMKQIEQQQILTTFPQYIPFTQCFDSYNRELLCKLLLNQDYNVRCRKDLE